MNQDRERERRERERDSIRWRRSGLTLHGQHRGTVTYPPRRNAPTIYILTRLWLRGSGASIAGTAIAGTATLVPPRARPSGVQQRVDDAITLTGHCESAGRDAIVRNDERRRERTPQFSLTAISLSFLV